MVQQTLPKNPENAYSYSGRVEQATLLRRDTLTTTRHTPPTPHTPQTTLPSPSSHKVGYHHGGDDGDGDGDDGDDMLIMW